MLFPITFPPGSSTTLYLSSFSFPFHDYKSNWVFSIAIYWEHKGIRHLSFVLPNMFSPVRINDFSIKMSVKFLNLFIVWFLILNGIKKLFLMPNYTDRGLIFWHWFYGMRFTPSITMKTAWTICMQNSLKYRGRCRQSTKL